MARAMTEAAAWRKLAEWCGTGDPKKRVYLCDRLSGRFDSAYGDHAPLPRGLPRVKMYERIVLHRMFSDIGNLVVDESDSWDKHASEGNHPRVIFCLLMALEAEVDAAERAR